MLIVFSGKVNASLVFSGKVNASLFCINVNSFFRQSGRESNWIRVMQAFMFANVPLCLSENQA